jgi:hypothetical protein
MKHSIYKELGHFQKFIFIQNWWRKTMACTWTTIIIYYNKLQNKLFQIHSYEKNYFGKKDMQSFFSNNPVGSLYPVHTV